MRLKRDAARYFHGLAFVVTGRSSVPAGKL